MSCKYAFYKEEENYFPRLYCKTDNNGCIFQKRCNLVEKFIQIDNFNERECFKFIMEEAKNIPKGSYFVQTYRKNKKGKLFLYVLIGDKIEKIITDLEEINQSYIYLKDTIDGYVVSLTPFESKRSTSRKK